MFGEANSRSSAARRDRLQWHCADARLRLRPLDPAIPICPAHIDDTRITIDVAMQPRIVDEARLDAAAR
jgi:hypothetical protein